jgi:hypothetical protein
MSHSPLAIEERIGPAIIVARKVVGASGHRVVRLHSRFACEGLTPLAGNLQMRYAELAGAYLLGRDVAPNVLLANDVQAIPWRLIRSKSGAQPDFYATES